MPAGSRLRSLASGARAAGALARLAVKVAAAYWSLRLRLWLWRRRSAARFAAAVRDALPEPLAAELAEEYRRELGRRARLPPLGRLLSRRGA